MSDDVNNEKSSPQVSARMVGIVLIVAALVAFIVQNNEEVPIRWLVLEFTAPLWVALVIAMALAYALGYLTSRSRAKRKR
ncbi:MAG: LapA family protein [Acidimicrobiia bacterium]|nr:LapA family protein [Acidimicrobiia bacterium]